MAAHINSSSAPVLRPAIAALALVSLVALAGCGTADPADTQEPVVSQSDSPEPSAAESEDSEPEWVGLELGDGSYSVSVPADWSVDDVVPSDPVQLDTYFFNAEGQQLLHFNIVSTDGGLGGACDPASPTFEVLATEPSTLEVDNGAQEGDPEIATVAIEQTEGGYGLGIGITSAGNLEQPYCFTYLLVRAADADAFGVFGTTMQVDYLMTDRADQIDSPFVFATREELDAYLAGKEYQQILQVLESVTYNGS